MTALFLFLLNRGITASFLILAVIGLRFLFRRLPKNPQLLLWALVALRLAVPFSLESSFSLIPKTEAVSVLTGSTVISHRVLSEMPVPTATVPAPAVTPQSALSQGVLPAASQASAAQAPFTGPSGTGNGLLVVCTLLWLMGAAGMLIYCLAAYLRLRKKLSVSLRLDGNVSLCDAIPGPFLLGLFRPRIYLPACLNQETQTYVLAHEKAHLRHGDAWWKMLGFLLLSVYWFHPLVWCGYWLFCQDLEMACDERAVKGMDHCQRKDYACTLLLCAAPKKPFPICPVSFSQSGIKARIANILQKKTTKRWVCLLAIMLAVILGCCFATNPKSDEKPLLEAEEQDPSEAQTAADFLRRYALAYSVFGGEAEAVEQMNAVTMEICQREPFRGLYNQNTGTLPIEGLAKLISTMLEKPLLNKIWHAASYTVPSTQELVYSTNALLPKNPLVLSHISQDSRVTGGLAARSGDYADLAVTAEYGGKRVLCILTGALRVSHPYMDNPSSYDVVDYWGNYEEMEKLLNIAFG